MVFNFLSSFQDSNAFIEMSPSSVDMKLRPFATSMKDQGIEDHIVGDGYHLASAEQQNNSYHTNSKEW